MRKMSEESKSDEKVRMTVSLDPETERKFNTARGLLISLVKSDVKKTEAFNLFLMLGIQQVLEEEEDAIEKMRSYAVGKKILEEVR